MGKLYEEITPELAAWVGQQHLFFVASAPLSARGHVNCSPKGLDTLRIRGPREVAYLDLTGSGAETIAHVRENGRILFMFCAFSGPPKIVRFHGTAEIVTPASPAWGDLRNLFPGYPAARAIVRARIDRIGDSCGYGVPLMEFGHDRDTMRKWAETKGQEALAAYRREKNSRSIDNLPALDVD